MSLRQSHGRRLYNLQMGGGSDADWRSRQSKKRTATLSKDSSPSKKVNYDYTRPMSYLDKELYKVPGPTKYFKAGHPLTTFTFENTELSPSILQGKNAPHYSIGKQDRGAFNRFVEKTNFGPGPAAYNSLSSLKTVIIRNKPKFQYYNEEGHNASVVRRTIAAQHHVV
eukprot:CAMPEP_0185572164 /NCGR_PEP_ID=MMETSP0434-20130131/4124_1 /TAXON_ID=626734 ORGANISM="Favella taraikaensis, Strain Fe Narragansett Bay" /NCGR_SAMPLE_ID=MMETSP0434 /ASSEMBLY_ACC=CAM_ASM_000379 /LENGTH=167 /DNA_ID=CAMNT_0028187905 /DNA_START=138 /DNA_END=641 /DNA_ORIENTATION=+